MKSVPDFSEEAVFWDRGLHLVAGVDEVGRGPLAGPVVASAVVLPSNPCFSWLRYVRDSKELTSIVRSNLSASIHHDALGIGISAVPHNVIDAIGIAEATRRAMLLAIRKASPVSAPTADRRRSSSRSPASPTVHCPRRCYLCVDCLCLNSSKSIPRPIDDQASRALWRLWLYQETRATQPASIWLRYAEWAPAQSIVDLLPPLSWRPTATGCANQWCLSDDCHGLRAKISPS